MPPLPFDDPRWETMKGGYRDYFDPRPLLLDLERGDASAWESLWEDLHHQDDVGEASYAAVAHLVRIHRQRDVLDWNTYALLACIELCRDHDDNPLMPGFLESSYREAWEQVPSLAARDLPRVQDGNEAMSIVAAVMLAKGRRTLARVLLDFEEDELKEMVDKYTSGPL